MSFMGWVLLKSTGNRQLDLHASPRRHSNQIRPLMLMVATRSPTVRMGAGRKRYLGYTGSQRPRHPVPPQRWHFTTLSPFFSRPLPSQFLHFCFFLILGPFSLAMDFPYDHL